MALKYYSYLLLSVCVILMAQKFANGQGKHKEMLTELALNGKIHSDDVYWSPMTLKDKHG